jgi:hypothetical protein
MSDSEPLRPVTAADRSVALGGLCALLAAAAWLYRPWERRPLGIVDVAEYVLVLRRTPGVVGRFGALVDYYAHQYGRFNPIVTAAIVTKWTAFGGDQAAWYWTRFAVMSAVVVLAYLVVRRLGASTAGGVVAASLLVFATPAAEGWSLLSIGEPIGTLFLLAALWLAAVYRSARRWSPFAAGIVVCLTAAVLAKEMLVFGAPVVLVIALCHTRPGHLSRPRSDRRTLWLLGACAAAISAAGGLVLTAARIPPGGFGEYRYSLANVGVDSWARLGTAVLPVTPSRPVEALPAIVANILFVFVLWVGSREAFRAGGPRRQLELRWVGVAALTPLVGTALYAPWPHETASYFFPMLVGSVMLLGRAASAGLARMPATRWATITACSAIYGIAATLDWRSARYREAELRLADATIRAVAFADNGVEHVAVRTRAPKARAWYTNMQIWPVYAWARYDRRLPPATVVACNDAGGDARPASALRELGAGLRNAPAPHGDGDRALRLFRLGADAGGA